MLDSGRWRLPWRSCRWTLDPGCGGSPFQITQGQRYLLNYRGGTDNLAEPHLWNQRRNQGSRGVEEETAREPWRPDNAQNRRHRPPPRIALCIEGILRGWLQASHRTLRHPAHDFSPEAACLSSTLHQLSTRLSGQPQHWLPVWDLALRSCRVPRPQITFLPHTGFRIHWGHHDLRQVWLPQRTIYS